MKIGCLKFNLIARNIKNNDRHAKTYIKKQRLAFITKTLQIFGKEKSLLRQPYSLNDFDIIYHEKIKFFINST
jgi:hypothetical protein